MTKTQARALAKRARNQSWGFYQTSPTTAEFGCPVHADHLREIGEHQWQSPHRITVHHKPYGKVTAPLVDAAFERHFLVQYVGCPTEHEEAMEV